MSINKITNPENLLICKKSAGFLFITGCCLFLFLSFGCDPGKEIFKEDTVLKINALEVSRAEYQLFLEQEKALTYNYFYRKYKAQKTDDFWERDFNGENPGVFIKEKVDQKLVRIKTIQEYATQIKLTEPFDYTDFLKDWEKDNRDRKEKHHAGQVVYGPVQTSVREYYNYLFTNLELKLKDKLNSSTFVPPQNELKSFFEKIKASHFSFVDTIATEQLILSYKTKLERAKRLALATEIINHSDKEISFKNIAKKHPQVSYLKKEYLGAVQLYGEENMDRALKEVAAKLKFNKIEIVDFQQKTDDHIYLIRLVKPLKKSSKSFAEVEKEVLYFYQVGKYQQLIDSLTQNSFLIKNEKIYHQLDLK